MTDVATHFPPQTYSSSFFLNALGEEDGDGGRRKIRARDKDTEDSPTFLDCFITKMLKLFQVALPFLLCILQWSSLFPAVNSTECIDVNSPRTRTFKSLTEFQANKIPFDPNNRNSEGNYVTFEESVLVTLHRNSFVAFDAAHIRKLSLDDHQIQHIEDETFLSLNCTSILSLRKNKIDVITSYTFKGLLHLHELDLSENVIKDVPEYVFRVHPGLKRLNLTRNNIRVVHPESFYKLSWLEELDLSYNQLRRISPLTFQYFGNLVNLQMGSNQIEQLDFDKWQNLTKLKVLNMSDNSLDSFDPSNAFSFGSSLEELYLDDNFLTRLNAYALRKNLPALKTIDISENLWICGDLTVVLKVLNDSRINYRGPEISEHNINGIACNRSEEYKKKRNDTEIDTTTTIIPAKQVSTTAIPRSNIEEPSVRAVYLSNMKILDSISSLKTVTVCLFVILLICILVDVVVRTGCLNVLTRRGRGVVLDNNDVENFSLLRDRF